MQKPPDGLIAVVKRDCPTCVLVAPVLRQIAGAAPLCILSQDDPDFPEGLAVTDERDLEQSFHLGIEIVPTLIRMQNGVETARVIGWNRTEWRGITAMPVLGEGLPENRPGCGAINIEPEHEARLVIRFGGGKPGEIDKSTLGNPGKYTFCFAEDEEGSDWEPLSVERGIAPGVSTVTLFAADGMHGIADQQSRDPHSLARSFAGSLRVVAHPKLVIAAEAFLVVCPEHARVFREAGWSKARLKEELHGLLQIPATEILRDGCAL